MKKTWLLFVIAVLSMTSNSAFAQKELGIFNTFAVGIDASTTGFGFDVAAPITPYVTVRAGLSFMPNFSFETDVDVDATVSGVSDTYTANIKAGTQRTTGELLVNLYPIPKVPLFIAAGASFGGSKIIKIDGHSDELQQIMSQAEEAGIVIGDYTIPVDQNGNVAGGLKSKNFRPYLGIGVGRAVPKNRVGFMFELGCQFGKMDVYTDYGTLGQALSMADDDISDILDKLTVYPVIKFRLCGRIL